MGVQTYGEYTVKFGHCKTLWSFFDSSSAQWSQARGHILGSIRNKSAVTGYWGLGSNYIYFKYYKSHLGNA